MATAAAIANPLDNPYLRSAEAEDGRIVYLLDDLLRVAGISPELTAREGGPDRSAAVAYRLFGIGGYPGPPDDVEEDEDDRSEFVDDRAALALLYSGRSPLSEAFRSLVNARWGSPLRADDSRDFGPMRYFTADAVLRGGPAEPAGADLAMVGLKLFQGGFRVRTPRPAPVGRYHRPWKGIELADLARITQDLHALETQRSQPLASPKVAW